MRIVAGTARGRRLVAPNVSTTRPTNDRVREAIFNALFSIDDIVTDASVLDLYAGTGALGLEALSRGAAQVTFVERDPRALAALTANIAGTGVDEHAVTVARTTAERWLDTRSEHTSFDLAFLDPPYEFDDWPTLIDRVPAGMAVIETNRDLVALVEASRCWEVIRHRRYGGTVVIMVRRYAST